MTKRARIDDYVFGNQFEKYGKAISLSRKAVIIAITFFCLITPGTNWMIPFLNKTVKRGLIWRY